MKKKYWFSIGAIVLVVVGAISYSFSGDETKESTMFTVKREDLTEIISEVGKVVPSKEINLTFPLTGTISQLLVEEGSRVNAGDLLARIESSKVQANLAKARSAVSEAQARLDKAYAGASSEDVRISETSVSNAETRLDKIILAAANDMELANANISAAETTLSSAQKSLEDETKDSEEDVRQDYEDAIDAMRSAETKSYAATKKIDYIQEKYFDSYEQIDDWVKAREKLVDDAFLALKPFVAAATTEDYATIDTALSETLSFLEDLSELLTYIRENLQVRSHISPTLTDEGYVDTERASIDTALTSITTVIQSINAEKLANEISLSDENASVSAAQKALEQAQASLNSTQSSWDSQISDAEGSLQLAKDQLALKKAGPRGEDVELYKSQVDQAMAYAQVVQQDITDSALYAPMNGAITRINVEVGELASLSGPVLSMMATGQHQVECSISELDIALLSVGDTAEVSFDAFGVGKIFKSIVVSIDPFETLVDEDVFYGITIGLDDYDPGIRSGMTANIDIKTDEKENVLVVPSRYIGEEDGLEYVKISKGLDEDGEVKYEKIEVKTGLMGTEMTEIISGVEEGTEIIPYY